MSNSSVRLRNNIGNDEKKTFYFSKQKCQIVSLNYSEIEKDT